MRHTPDVVKELLDKSYKLGGRGDSYDCLSLFLEFHERCGIRMPREWRGWTRENYAERWLRGEGREEYYEFLCEVTEHVEPKYLRERDLIIMKKAGVMYTAMYLGSNHVLCVMENQGVQVLPLWAIKHIITDIRRVRKNGKTS
jgi:hypothetical protein